MTEDPKYLDNVIVHDGVTWVPGTGDTPADLVFLAERPNQQVVRQRKAFRGTEEQLVIAEANKAGLRDLQLRVHKTYAVKYSAKGGKNTNAGDRKRCANLLYQELKALNPKYVVCIGLQPLKALMGNAAKLSDYQGAFVDCVLEDPSFVRDPVKKSKKKAVEVDDLDEPLSLDDRAYIDENPEPPADAAAVPESIRFKVFTIMGLGLLNSSPWRIPMLTKLMQYLVYYIRSDGQPLEKEPGRAVLTTDAAAQTFLNLMLAKPKRFFMLDMEWNGETWMHADRKIVTIQFGLDRNTAIILELYNEDETSNFSQPTLALLKQLLEDPGTSLGGHGIAADSQWLMSYGIDIRKNICYDTMLAESLLNSQGPFGLEELTLKYTWVGRYDFGLSMWKQQVKKQTFEHGYMRVPRSILIPYGAWDVCALFPIMEAQVPLLDKYGFFEPRGNECSLWVSELQTANNILEIEQSGLLVDRPMLDDIQARYTTRLAELEAALKVMLGRVGMPEFNFRSTRDVAALLFNVLKLSPIKTTKGKDWKRAVSNQPAEEQALYSPSTDKTTLEILEGAHPIIKPLSNTQRLETLVKTYLRDNEEADCSTRGGGINAKIWPDGRLHPHFTMLTKTGRFNCSKPNIQNWPKRADKYLADIFGGKELVPPNMRHIIIPAPGNVLIEADFKQAELFVLAYLSGDPNMIRNLETPGLDAHTTTTVTAFKMRVVYGPLDTPVNEAEMLELAKRDLKAFETLQNEFVYVDQRGIRYPYPVFKEGPRVSGKSIGFGVPYSRGALDIARQIKAETGSDRPLSEIEAETAMMIEAWKNDIFPTAWAYLEGCAAAVESPGYLKNPWGRYRFFTMTEKSEIVDAQKREAQNCVIQSTVADTVMIAMQRLVDYRIRTGLKYKLVNQIHDAVMLEAPESEIEQTIQAFKETMGTIAIPMGDRVLTLGVDITVLDRWGVKRKQKK